MYVLTQVRDNKELMYLKNLVKGKKQKHSAQKNPVLFFGLFAENADLAQQ